MTTPLSPSQVSEIQARHQYDSGSTWATSDSKGIQAHDDRAALLAHLRSVGAAGEDAATRDRELVASWMMRNGYATGHGDEVADLLSELTRQHHERFEKLALPAQSEPTQTKEPQP